MLTALLGRFILAIPLTCLGLTDLHRRHRARKAQHGRSQYREDRKGAEGFAFGIVPRNLTSPAICFSETIRAFPPRRKGETKENMQSLG